MTGVNGATTLRQGQELKGQENKQGQGRQEMLHTNNTNLGEALPRSTGVRLQKQPLSNPSTIRRVSILHASSPTSHIFPRLRRGAKQANPPTWPPRLSASSGGSKTRCRPAFSLCGIGAIRGWLVTRTFTWQTGMVYVRYTLAQGAFPNRWPLRPSSIDPVVVG